MKTHIEYKDIYQHVQNIINHINKDQKIEDQKTISQEKKEAAKGWKVLWLFPILKKILTTEETINRLDIQASNIMFGVGWRSRAGWGDLKMAEKLKYGIEKAMKSNSLITLENEDIEFLHRLDYLNKKDNSPTRY